VEWNPATWIRDGRQYLSEVRSEFRKVTWPAQKEYVGGTIGVLVVVSIITLVLGVLDLGLAEITQLVIP
jgi:preprotein translocase subunit SecE